MSATTLVTTIPPVTATRRTTLSLPAAAPVRLSSDRRALIEAMRSAPTRGWQLLHGGALTVRWDRQVPTPRWAREPGGWDWRSDTAAPLWADPTCPQRVLVTLTAPSAAPVVGLWRAPWAVRLDQPVTLARALAVLADPDAALDDPGRPQRPAPARQAQVPEAPARGARRGARPDRGHRPEDPPYKVIGGIVYLARTPR